MAKEIFHIEIQRIPLEIAQDGLSEQEITGLVAEVEAEMAALEQEGVIDIVKQALRVAVSFAKRAYLQDKQAQAKQKEDDKHTAALIARLENSLKEPEEKHD